jgi:hypothetical protein
MTAAAVAVGVALAATGAGVAQLWSGVTMPLVAALGAVALAYALHELGFLRLPVPGRDWQVPVEWLRAGFYRSAVIFGGTVGFGMFTRVPFAALPVLFAWLFVSGNTLYGLVAGLAYGATRGISIYISASCSGPSDAAEINQRLMALTPFLHQATGVALAAFGAYLLLSPWLT